MKSFLKTIFTISVFAVVLYLCVPLVMKTIYPLKYEDAISENAQKYGLDKYLVMGVISAESRFSENAVSHKNAKGLMQLKDETALWCAEKYDIEGEAYLPEVNIEIGCAYIKYLLDVFEGDIKNALCAYNAGQGNVKNWLTDKKYSANGKTLDKIPYKETREYAERVQRRAKIYKNLYGEK